jgi:putative phage-type endonuclease
VSPALTPKNDLVRARCVTASEVGALLGEHPYMTPERIWERLNGLAEPTVPNEYMETGTHMESAILRLAEKRLGIRARANPYTYQHPVVPLCATPDALVIAGSLTLDAVPGLIEIKLSGRTDLWRSVPEYVEWQVRAQMACTGRRTAAIAVLVGSGLRTFILEYDPLAELRLTDAVTTFWTEHMLTGVRPVTPTTDPVLPFDRS